MSKILDWVKQDLLGNIHIIINNTSLNKGFYLVFFKILVIALLSNINENKCDQVYCKYECETNNEYECKEIRMFWQ